MTGPRDRTVQRVRDAAGLLQAEARSRLSRITWFRALDADVRSWVGLVVDSGIAAFLDWIGDEASPRPLEVFASAPAAAARAVPLQQTIELLETVLDSVETVAPLLADESDEQWLRGRVERFGRELAFAAAAVYARVAEQRGAWDARLQALVVDALVAGGSERVLTSRASALGWPATRPVRVVALRIPDEAPDRVLRTVQDAAGRQGPPFLAALHGEAVVLVLGGATSDEPALRLVEQLLPVESGAVISGQADSLGAAAESTREALAGLAVLSAWRGRAGPLLADELLPERALAGDVDAGRRLVELYHKPVADYGSELVETLDVLLAAGGNLEAAARALPVHVNTLRYRLTRLAELTGKDARTPRDRLLLEMAAMLSRLPVLPRL